MREYQTLGHMSEISYLEDSQDVESYYIPHFPVMRETSSTTPLRVVFNASQKTNNGISLNDTLLVGSQIQGDLVSILLRFRMFNYTLIGYIQKFFRQIKVNNNNVPYKKSGGEKTEKNQYTYTN